MATTTQEKLQALISAGHATDENIKWGRGYRRVIILGGKKSINTTVIRFPEFLKIKCLPCI